MALTYNQLRSRNTAVYVWPRIFVLADTVRLLDLAAKVSEISMLPAELAILREVNEEPMSIWQKSGWIELSPDCVYVRLTTAGKEQLARWQEEDRLWHEGPGAVVQSPKRLRAGEPATNLRRIRDLVGGRTVDGIHDPYIKLTALENLQRLKEIGLSVSANLRWLGSKVDMGGNVLQGFIAQLNTENQSQWAFRKYSIAKPGSPKPHRRFFLCADGAVLTIGCSLDSLNKDETLDLLASNDPNAQEDKKFFEDNWKNGVAV